MDGPVLIAVDYSDWGRAALATGIELARALGVSVVLVHAVAPFVPPRRTDPKVAEELEEAKASIREEAAIDLTTQWAETVRASDLEVVPVVDEAEPTRLILDTADEQAAALIVLGSHGRTGLQRLLMGSVASEVLRSARCPVVVVPRRD